VGSAVVSSGPFGELPDPRKAHDFVAFTKDAQSEAGNDSGDVLAPGTAASGGLTAYWFGPTLGPRRATVAAQGSANMSNTDDPKLFPQYVTVYQRPEDGCQSGLLASYEEAPDYWGPGDEVEVISEPIGHR
jgi:hypothetical protein